MNYRKGEFVAETAIFRPNLSAAVKDCRLWRNGWLEDPPGAVARCAAALAGGFLRNGLHQSFRDQLNRAERQFVVRELFVQRGGARTQLGEPRGGSPVYERAVLSDPREFEAVGVHKPVLLVRFRTGERRLARFYPPRLLADKLCQPLGHHQQLRDAILRAVSEQGHGRLPLFAGAEARQ